MTTIQVLVTLKRLPYLCEGIRLFYLYFSESDVAKDRGYNSNKRTAACKN